MKNFKMDHDQSCLMPNYGAKYFLLSLKFMGLLDFSP